MSANNFIGKLKEEKKNLVNETFNAIDDDDSTKSILKLNFYKSEMET